MQVQASASPFSKQPKLLTKAEVAWVEFTHAVVALAKADYCSENLPVFYGCVAAYRALRDAHVTPRKSRRGRAKARDVRLEAWAEQRAAFLTRFWGRDDGHWEGAGEARRWRSRRSFIGVDAETKRYMLAYQSLWNLWWPHTPGGLESKKKANARQAQRPEVQATKAAYVKSEPGRAAVKRSRAKTKRAATIAKGAAEQARYDSWANEEEFEKVLGDV